MTTPAANLYPRENLIEELAMFHETFTKSLDEVRECSKRNMKIVSQMNFDVTIYILHIWLYNYNTANGTRMWVRCEVQRRYS